MAYDVKSFNIEKNITIYGSARKGIIASAHLRGGALPQPKAVAVFDSDLISITPLWIKNILDPVIVDTTSCPGLHALQVRRHHHQLHRLQPHPCPLCCRSDSPSGVISGTPRLAKHYLDQEDVGRLMWRFGVDI
jgi:hypothetical protein